MYEFDAPEINAQRIFDNLLMPLFFWCLIEYCIQRLKNSRITHIKLEILFNKLLFIWRRKVSLNKCLSSIPWTQHDVLLRTKIIYRCYSAEIRQTIFRKCYLCIWDLFIVDYEHKSLIHHKWQRNLFRLSCMRWSWSRNNNLIELSLLAIFLMLR